MCLGVQACISLKSLTRKKKKNRRCGHFNIKARELKEREEKLLN